MLFTGHSEHTIDAKLRLAVPAKYRNQWDVTRDGSAWYCVPWPDGSLRLFTERMFEHLSGQIASSVAPGPDVAAMEELFVYAERLTVDTQGRVAVPRTHLELIGLQPAEGQDSIDVTIVGKRNRLEVRARQPFQDGFKEKFQRLSEVAARMEASPAATPA